MLTDSCWAAGAQCVRTRIAYASSASSVTSASAAQRIASLTAEDWTPREMRHSFVSLLSDSGVPIENIARLVGHAGGSEVTETVYRKQIRPVLLAGAEAMDQIFSRRHGAA